MSLIDRVHGQYVHTRRGRTLSRQIAPLLPPGRVLDVGCGDGSLDHLIMQRRTDIQISGIDLLVRGETRIPVTGFDGRRVPHGDGSFDAVIFVDVLHHTEDPMILLREAARVARRAVIIKDHTRDGWLAGPTLRLMDYVGNARHGVALPYNYWPRRRWLEAFDELALRVGHWEHDLHLARLDLE
jgi:SAM-dependent methyltransferase